MQHRKTGIDDTDIEACFSVLQFGAAWLYQLQTISQDVP